MNLDNATAAMVLDALFGTAAFVATTNPVKARLTTTVPTAAAAGTQVTGGSYAAQTLTMASAVGPTATNSGALAYTGITAGTVVQGVDIYDSAGTPKRKAFAVLNTPKTVGADGLLNIAAGNLTIQPV